MSVPAAVVRALSPALRAARDATDAVRPWRVFDRPVFVLSVPRTGSTLLMDMLDEHPGLWGWFREASEGWVHGRPAGHDVLMGDTWPISYATEPTRRRLERTLFREGVRSREERRGIPRGLHGRLAHRKVRYFDKTPANCMRTAVLAALWPDARFVFLHRDGPSNVASLVEAWPSRLGMRDPILDDGSKVEWRMLMPEGFIDHLDESIAARCAFQWIAGNTAILEGLADVDGSRILEVRYADLVEAPVETARALCEFAEVGWHPDVEAFCARMPPTRVVLSAPAKDKWRARYDELAPVLPSLVTLSERMGYPTDW